MNLNAFARSCRIYGSNEKSVDFIILIVESRLSDYISKLRETPLTLMRILRLK
ncbi:hypothetical protein L336_0122 [Candidatus Saccharimonas aalborgensis]|uniref:Uncharacterized protein n=1 Tax=Candidatus Saccharimonas aalborgensis TaxID=1332188 RepID=R4PK07_9BACT|nr:hypothetical protein L336_0122 [Candidatus Saccharimonas aalborgensis]